MKIVYVKSDCDWEAVYVDGKLFQENHRICMDNVLWFVVGKTLDSYIAEWADTVWLEEAESFPENLDDVVFFKNS